MLIISLILWLAILFMIGATSIADLIYALSGLIIVAISLRHLQSRRWNPVAVMKRASRRYAGFGSTSVPTLVITYFVDEALSAIWMGLAMPRALLTGAATVASEQTRMRLGLAAAPVIFLIALAFGSSGLDAAIAGARITSTVTILCLSIAFVFVLANRFIGPLLAAMTLGPRGALDFFHMNLSVSALPSAERPELVREVELAPPEGWRPRFSLRLRHCYIYSDPQTVALVVDWLSEHMSKRVRRCGRGSA
jgi:hypothetical protein